MKSALLYILLFTGYLVQAQSTWFQLIPGWTAKQTHVLGDTLVSFGTGLNQHGYFIPVNYTNGVSGKLYFTDTLDYFQLSGDSITGLSYGSSCQGFYDEKNNRFRIGLSYRDSIDGRQDWQAALFNTSPLEKTVELSHKDFRSLMAFYDQIGDYYYVIVYWVTILDNGVAASNKVYRIDDNGNIKIIKHVINQKICSGCHNLTFEKILPDNQSSENLFLLLNDQWDFRGGPNSYQGEIVKMDTNGNTLWRSRPNVNDSFNTSGFQCVQKPNGNLICCWSDIYYRSHKNPRGVPFQDNHDSASLWFTEIDYTNGKVLWIKTIRPYLSKKLIHNTDGYHFIFTSGIISKDQGLLFFGQYLEDKWYPFLIKTDMACNPIWYREYDVKPDTMIEDGDQGMEVNHCVVTPDNGLILSGEYIHYNGVQDSLLLQSGALLKLDSFGCLEPGCQQFDDTASKPNPHGGGDTTVLTQSKIYPNPVQETLTIELPGTFPNKWQVSLIDALGRTHKQYEVNEQKHTLSVNNLSPGIYIIQLQQLNSNRYETHKIRVQP